MTTEVEGAEAFCARYERLQRNSGCPMSELIRQVDARDLAQRVVALEEAADEATVAAKAADEVFLKERLFWTASYLHLRIELLKVLRSTAP